MAETRAQSNRRVRQEALREKLATGGLIQKVIDTTNEIDELSLTESIMEEAARLEVDPDDLVSLRKFRIDALDKATRHRLTLINKFLPDLKSVEMEHGVSDELSNRLTEALAHVRSRRDA